VPGPRPAPANNAFGIEQAIQLIRRLPTGNADLVMTVVKQTLESLNVDVHQLIDSADAKAVALESRINELMHEVAALEEKINAKNELIIELQDQERELNTVKEQLNMARGPVPR
jgi:predicted  nucleic acid-binding Zn-ribbon protein